MSGNPAGAVAGLVSLDLLARDGVYERLYDITDRLRQALRDLAADRGLSVRVLGEGPVMQMLYASADVTDYPSFLDTDRASRATSGRSSSGLSSASSPSSSCPGPERAIRLHPDDDPRDRGRGPGDLYRSGHRLVQRQRGRGPDRLRGRRDHRAVHLGHDRRPSLDGLTKSFGQSLAFQLKTRRIRMRRVFRVSSVPRAFTRGRYAPCRNPAPSAPP